MSMTFANFATALEATLLTEHEVELCRARSGDGRVEWFVGAMTLRLEVDTVESVALSASIDDVEIRPVLFPMTFRSMRAVANDLAALVDLPSTTSN